MRTDPSRGGEPDRNGVRMGPLWLTPEISRANAVTLLFSSFSIIGLLTFMNVAQPMVLQEILHVPQDKQGALTGNLGALQEGIYMCLVGFLGALSDRHGRRIIYVVGVLTLAVGFVIIPTAGSISELVAFRVVYAVGMSAAAVMLHTCIAEYTQNTSRGRWMGMISLINGMGVLVMSFGLAKLPAWYGTLGFGPAESVRYSLWSMGAYFVGLAIVLRLGLKGRSSLESRAAESVLRLLRRGLAAARTNRRITLSYAMAFAARGDLAVLTAFFFLWLVQAGNDLGMSPSISTARAGMFFGIAQGIALLWGVLMGFVLDRLNRMTVMCVAFALAAAGYLALSQVSDPFGGNMMIPACILVGIGEASAMVAGGVLIGQEAPAKIRGAVMGTFSLMGAGGMLFIVFVGGYAFDYLGRTSPFLLMALINFSVFLAALSVRVPGRRRALAADSAATRLPD